MIKDILTKGLLLKSFVFFLWGVALFTRCFDSGEDTMLVFLFLGASNVFLYLSVATRLVILTHYSMSNLLPDYFSALKKSLLLILGLSFIPTLLLLPDIVLWFSLLSLLLLMAIAVVAITYQPKLYFAVFPMLSIGYLMGGGDYLNPLTPHIDRSLMLAFAFPFVAGLAYFLLNRLEKFKGDAIQIERLITLTGLNTNIAIPSLEKVPLKSQNKLVQWVVNNNFEYYRRLIRSKNGMTNRQRIATACQGNSTIGRTSFYLWGAVSIVFSVIGSYLEQEYLDMLIVAIIMIPSIFLGLGAIGSLQVINSKKELIKRLSIMPCFNHRQSFSSAFVSYVLYEQLKLFTFIVFVSAVFAYSFEFISMTMYSNALIIVSIIFLFNIALMFLAWSSVHPNNTVVVWLMVFILIGGYTALIAVSGNGILLWNSTMAITLIIMGASLCSFSLYRCRRNIHQNR